MGCILSVSNSKNMPPVRNMRGLKRDAGEGVGLREMSTDGVVAGKNSLTSSLGRRAPLVTGIQMVNEGLRPYAGVAMQGAEIQSSTNPTATTVVIPRPWRSGWHENMHKGSLLFAAPQQEGETIQSRGASGGKYYIPNTASPIGDPATINYILELCARNDAIIQMHTGTGAIVKTSAVKEALSSNARFAKYSAKTPSKFMDIWSWLGVQVNEGIPFAASNLGKMRAIPVAVKGNAETPNIFGRPCVGDFVGLTLRSEVGYGAFFTPSGVAVGGPTVLPRKFLQLRPFTSVLRHPYHLTGEDGIPTGDDLDSIVERPYFVEGVLHTAETYEFGHFFNVGIVTHTKGASRSSEASLHVRTQTSKEPNLTVQVSSG